MKLAKRFLFGAMAALVLAGCSDDKLGPEGPNGGNGSSGEIKDGVYMSVNIKMPTAGSGRSYTEKPDTSNSGFEVGKDRENNVNTVYLVLAKYSATNKDVNNTFIAWGEIPAGSITKSTDGTQYNATANFSRSTLQFYYDNLTEDESTDVNVYVFCNPTQNLRTILDTESLKSAAEKAKKEWINAVGRYDAKDINAEIIWSDNNFLMSNNSIAIRSLPKEMKDWDYYTEETNPFDLSGKNEELPDCDNSADSELARGAVRVERTAARFDFRDASKLGNSTYNVLMPDEPLYAYDGDDDETNNKLLGDDGKPYLVNVHLTKMSLTNMAKQYYYLRRVSDNGLADPTSDGYKICGAELPWFTDVNGQLIENKHGNYVVNPLATEMANIPLPVGFSDLNFNYPFFNAEGEITTPLIDNWFTSEIKSVVQNEADNYQDKNYHIWRYVIENTIPGVEAQKNGQSTGIIFKGRIEATPEAFLADDENIRELAHYLNNEPFDGKTEKPLTGDLDKDPIIYKYTGVRNNIGGMYSTWPNVEKEAKERAIVPVWEADNTEAGGYWRLEINRAEPLYRAVFGENGCCIKYTFEDSSGKEYTVNDPTGDAYTHGSAAEAWHNWDDAGRPIPQSASELQNSLYYIFKRAATANHFTLYQTSYDGHSEESTDGEYGYYCYYYYWNRHNDNRQNSIMTPMEFAVVRNNVYKIAVTEINHIGHPRITINDPDAPTPNTDDENDDVYIKVDVNVLPWVVRINNADF